MAISKSALYDYRAAATAAMPVPRQTPRQDAWPQPGLRGRRGETSAPRPDLSRLGQGLGGLDVRFEPEEGTLWCGFVHHERPCFTPEVLDHIARLQHRLRFALHGAEDAGTLPVQVLVWYSTLPDLWNLGGDLALFTRLIRAGERDALIRYARACIDPLYQNWIKLDLPILTVALVQGDALGGGMEHVLTCDLVVAERQSKFGLPEVLFNLFPGMGAYSILSRRLGGVAAERMIRSGRLYDAEELEAMGLVDLVVEPGEGPAALRAYLDRNRRRLGLWDRLSAVRRRCQPITYEELLDVTELWVDTALTLEESDLRRMERLAAAQERRLERTRRVPMAAGA